MQGEFVVWLHLLSKLAEKQKVNLVIPAALEKKQS